MSLAVLCVGLLVFQLPSNILELIWRNSDSELPTDAMRQFFQSASGSLVGLAIAFNSSFASIYSEVILKQPKSFWAAQFWLYLYGIAFAGFSSLFWDGSFQKTRQPSAIVADVHQYICINAAVIFATAGTGLAVAAILRKRDNLVKLIGTAAGMVTLVVVQSIAFPALRAKTLTVQTILGAGTIAITTWTYNYYKDLQPHSYMQLARLSTIVEDDDKSFEQFLDQKKCDTQISEVSIEEIEEEDSSSYSYSFTPTPTASRLCSAVLGVVVLATLTALFHPIAR